MSTKPPKSGPALYNQLSETTRLLCNAIERRLCLSFTASGRACVFAPHVVYRGLWGLPRIDGVVLIRGDKPIRRSKVQSFRVDRLTDVRLTDQTFSPDSVFDPCAGRYWNRIIRMVAAE